MSVSPPWEPDEPVRRRPGVRANALRAAGFVRLGDVDPRVVEPLLDSLEDAGVAAFAEPVAQGSAYTQHVEQRRRPEPLREQLYVDRDQRSLAESVVAAELPGLLAELTPDPDHDAAFAEIVAGWDATPEAPVAPWPVAEDVPHDRADSDDTPAELYPPPPPPAEDDHYVPPPPAPVPPAQTATKMAIAAIAGGFLLLVGAHRLLGFDATYTSTALGALAVVVGVITLVARMRDRPPYDDGPDDGAVV